jgi:hypothetical protein
MTTTSTASIFSMPSDRLRPRRLSPLAMLIFAGCCSFFELSCLAIPIPQGYRNLESEGQRIGEARLGFVVPGETTKAEFIERIGQPYLVLDDLGVMAYYWKMLAAYVPWIAGWYGGGTGGVVEVDRQNVLLVAYDDRAIIERYEFIRKLQANAICKPNTVEELARQWAAKIHQSRNYAAAGPPVDKSVVYVFHNIKPYNMERTNSLDGVFLDGKLWAELKPGQYAAIPLSPGPHVIGFERDIRTTDKFLHPDRQNPLPVLMEAIDARADQTYFLEVYFLERDSRDYKKTPVFSRLSEDVARPKLAGLARAR